MSDGQAQLQDFLAGLRELASAEVTVDWRQLERAEIVYFEPLKDSAGRGLEIVLGADECQLSIGDLVTRDIGLSRASDVARVQRIISGVMLNGLTQWKSGWQTFVCVGTSDENEAPAHIRSRTAPSVVTRWEPWVTSAVRSSLVSRFGRGQSVEWL